MGGKIWEWRDVYISGQTQQHLDELQQYAEAPGRGRRNGGELNVVTVPSKEPRVGFGFGVGVGFRLRW